MIRPPPPCLTICRAAAWQQKKTPVRFTRSTRCHSASGCSRNGAEWAMPALANMTSTRPSSRATRSTSDWTAAASPTSTPTAMAFPPLAAISAATALAASSCTSASATAAPSSAKSRAVARPMPSAPPVITATRSSKRMVSFRPASVRALERLVEARRPLLGERLHPLDGVRMVIGHRGLGGDLVEGLGKRQLGGVVDRALEKPHRYLRPLGQLSPEVDRPRHQGLGLGHLVDEAQVERFPGRHDPLSHQEVHGPGHAEE